MTGFSLSMKFEGKSYDYGNYPTMEYARAFIKIEQPHYESLIADGAIFTIRNQDEIDSPIVWSSTNCPIFSK